jgi:hypothetical protein
MNRRAGGVPPLVDPRQPSSSTQEASSSESSKPTLFFILLFLLFFTAKRPTEDRAQKATTLNAIPSRVGLGAFPHLQR